MGRKPISIKHENLMSVKDMIGQMAKECEQKKPQKIMPPRLKKLTEALNLATSESDQWKELHHSRKNQYNMAKVGKECFFKGTFKLERSARASRTRFLCFLWL